MLEAEGFKWEEPPTTRRKYTRGRYTAALEALLASPNRWARIDLFEDGKKAHSTRTNLVYAVKLKRYNLPPPPEGGGWEFTVRKLPAEGWALFARLALKEVER
jgi:Ni/Co efflux regulator RcnB